MNTRVGFCGGNRLPGESNIAPGEPTWPSRLAVGIGVVGAAWRVERTVKERCGAARSKLKLFAGLVSLVCLRPLFHDHAFCVRSRL
jgi:hypothetical protein